MDLTSRQLRAFLLVARHHSFTHAAEALFITPSGLSLLIRELENQLGFRLFDRTTRHVALTAQGEQLLPVAERNLHELEAAVSRIGRSAKAASQSLSLGAPFIIAANILPQAIKEFHALRPNLRIQVFDAYHGTLMEMVKEAKLDIALGSFLMSAPGVRRTPFFRFSLMVIRADCDPALRRASTTWSALKGERLIGGPPTSEFQQIVDGRLARAGVVSQPYMVLNALDTIIAMVEAGEGVAIIPSYGLPACRNRRVVMSRLINPTVHMDFYQIRNRGKQLPPGADEFTSFLRGYIARWVGRAGIL